MRIFNYLILNVKDIEYIKGCEFTECKCDYNCKSIKIKLRNKSNFNSKYKYYKPFLPTINDYILIGLDNKLKWFLKKIGKYKYSILERIEKGTIDGI